MDIKMDFVKEYVLKRLAVSPKNNSFCEELRRSVTDQDKMDQLYSENGWLGKDNTYEYFFWKYTLLSVGNMVKEYKKRIILVNIEYNDEECDGEKHLEFLIVKTHNGQMIIVGYDYYLQTDIYYEGSANKPAEFILNLNNIISSVEQNRNLIVK